MKLNFHTHPLERHADDVANLESTIKFTLQDDIYNTVALSVGYQLQRQYDRFIKYGFDIRNLCYIDTGELVQPYFFSLESEEMDVKMLDCWIVGAKYSDLSFIDYHPQTVTLTVYGDFY